jgi:hypothetical protein
MFGKHAGFLRWYLKVIGVSVLSAHSTWNIKTSGTQDAFTHFKYLLSNTSLQNHLQKH